ncbi:hypothetical protein MBLNU459_g1215t1, partial [Dothideomycetes sp. NU459]
PEFKGVPKADLADNNATRPAFRKFGRRLNSGYRWSQISQKLGPGVLALVPEDLIGKRFVETDVFLRNFEFNIWLDLIHHVNPECIRLGAMFNDQIDSALYGLDAPRKRLLLETIPKTKIRDYEDMSLLLEEVNEGLLTSGDEAQQRRQPYDDSMEMMDIGL